MMVVLALFMFVIACVAYKKYPYSDKKLKEGEYGGQCFLLTMIVFGVSSSIETLLKAENQILVLVLLLAGYVAIGIAVSHFTKQIVYDYQNRKHIFRKINR